MRDGERPRTIPAILWFLFVLVGWIAFAYLFFAGRVDDVWTWMRGLPIVAQVALWAFLLPWIIAAWVWQSGWATWLRAFVVLGLVFASFMVSVPQLIDATKSK